MVGGQSVDGGKIGQQGSLTSSVRAERRLLLLLLGGLPEDASCRLLWLLWLLLLLLPVAAEHWVRGERVKREGKRVRVVPR